MESDSLMISKNPTTTQIICIKYNQKLSNMICSDFSYKNEYKILTINRTSHDLCEERLHDVAYIDVGDGCWRKNQNDSSTNIIELSPSSSH